MSRKEQLNQIIGLLLNGKGHDELPLAAPIEVPTGTPFVSCLIHALQVSPYGDLWLMDGIGWWYPLLDKEKDAVVIEAVYKVVKELPELAKSEVVL